MFTLKGKQQEVLNLPYDGHNVFLGAAGSGKSVCATKRAEYLSMVTEGEVLLISFNNSLVNYLRDISKGYLENVDLRTYHSLATKYMRENGLLNDDEILTKDIEKKALIKKAIEDVIDIVGSNSTLQRTEFIFDEIKWMQGIGALKRDIYETIERAGRGKTRLLKENRKYIFDVYEEYVRLRTNKNYKYDWDDIAYYFYKDVSKRNFPNKYKHIIIDEGQDFSPTMIKSIVFYVKDTGSIMFFGDSAQQIYGNKISWRESGLKIRKVYKLDENYRNSIQIEKLANEIRKSMDLVKEEVDYPISSSRNSKLPEVIGFDSENEELQFVINKLCNIQKNRSVAVIFKKNDDVSKFCKNLNTKGIHYTRVNRDTKNFADLKGIFVGTYHSTKGLEFDSVIIPYCVDSHLIDNNRALALESEEELSIEVSKLLYVAITRAKEELIITYTGNIVRVFPKKDDSLYTSLRG